MCRPGPDVNCEHLPRKVDSSATTFSIRTGKHVDSEPDAILPYHYDVTIEIRLCKRCTESFMKDMAVTDADKNKYGQYRLDILDTDE